MGMPLPSQEFSGTSMSAEEARLKGLQLAQDRKVIDEEIHSNIKVLQEQGATMTSPLVDAQGFPVATTDIVAVRTARSRINALRNDREAIEKRMRDVLEIALAKKEEQQRASSIQGAAADGNLSSQNLSGVSQAWARTDGRREGLSMMVETQEGNVDDWRQVGGMVAFARVNSVADSSPAQTADLRVEDEVLTFGDLDGTTAHQSVARKDLRNLPSVVQEGKEISLTVLRKDANGQRAIKRLRLTPLSNWGGRGLLGCHLIPI